MNREKVDFIMQLCDFCRPYDYNQGFLDIWHLIGLVRDGSLRTLYVDGLVASEDTQDNLGGSDTGLYIGTGKSMES